MRTLIDCNRKIKYNIKDGKSKKEIKRLWNSPKGIAGRQFMLNISFPFTAALLCWMEKRIDNGTQPCVKQMSSFLIELTSKSTDTREVRALQKEYIVAYKFYFSVNRGKSTWKKKMMWSPSKTKRQQYQSKTWQAQEWESLWNLP